MNSAVLGTACMGVARLGCACLGDGLGVSSSDGIRTTLLPAEYQQVEYIESTGTQYINTNILMTDATQNKMQFALQVTDTTKGFNQNIGSNGYLGMYQINTNNLYFRIFGVDIQALDTQKHIVEITRGLIERYFIFDGVRIDREIAAKSNTIKQFLFSNDSSITLRGSHKLFYCKLYQDDILVRDFIPCYRKSDNEIGMYDVVNDVFYTNNGTGTFLKGADVNDKEYSTPYIKGHITTNDSTFTFSVDGKQKSVSVDANGDFKFKVKKAITSLSFVGVPQLESLELFAIDGVTTFDVDYPVAVSYLRCDSTTKSAKNDVYHIRGTATDDFSFTIQYIADGTPSTVTENAVIDENGNWDIAYSGKRIRNLREYFSSKTELTSIEFTDNLEYNASLYYNSNSSGTFSNCTNLQRIKFAKNTILKGSSLISVFLQCSSLTEIVNSDTMVFDSAQTSIRLSGLSSVTINYGMFRGCAFETLDISSLDFSNVTKCLNTFKGCSSLKNLYVKQGTLQCDINLKDCPLTYESMVRVADWLKDYSNGDYVKLGTQNQTMWNNKGDVDWYYLDNGEYVIAESFNSSTYYYSKQKQTVTFRKETYDNLTAEQKSNLLGIIEDTKKWLLATA